MKEFNIITKYLRPLSKNNYGAMNLTDDVYFDLKKNIAISVDTYIENKHFLFYKDSVISSKYYCIYNYLIFMIRQPYLQRKSLNNHLY